RVAGMTAPDRPDLDRREHIARMVRDFYRDVAMDDLLGPVFEAAGVDWSVHIPKLVDFWAWQLLGEIGKRRGGNTAGQCRRDGIRDFHVTGVQTCALPILRVAGMTAPDRPDLDRREHIARMVRDFYRDVAMDDLLGPVFEAAGVDWSVHIPKLVDFWAWQLLGEIGKHTSELQSRENLVCRL